MKFIYGTSAKSAGIYQIKNTKTGRLYLAATISFQHRWHEDKIALDAGVFHNTALQRDYIKYGHAAFQCSIVKVCDPQLLLITLTNEVATVLGPKCYNKHPVELQKENFVLPPVVEARPFISRYLDREKMNKRSDEYAAVMAWANKSQDKIIATRNITLAEQLANLNLPEWK
jgi:hypothetical protein